MKVHSFIIIIIFMFTKGYSQNTWDKTLSKMYGTQHVRAVFETADEGYLLAGYVNYPNSGRAWLIKTDAFGDTLWSKVYNFGINFGDPIRSILQTPENNYVFIGDVKAGLGVTKVNSIGDIIWSKYYWNGVSTSANDIKLTYDNGYIIVGEYGGVNHKKLMIFKINSEGDSLWSKIYGSGEEKQYLASSVQQTNDGNYIIAGAIYTDHHSLWIVKTDSLGDTLWTKQYNKPGYYSVYAQKILNTPQNNEYVVLGNPYKIEDEPDSPLKYLNYDIWLLKINAAGDTLWTKTYGGDKSDFAYSIQNTKDKGYIISGSTDSFSKNGYDAWLIRIDIKGDILWTQAYNKWTNDTARNVKQTVDGGYIFAADIIPIGGSSSIFWLVKTDSIGFSNLLTGIEPKNKSSNNFTLAQNYPNPFNPKTTITYFLERSSNVNLNVFDISGRKVQAIINQFQKAGEYSITFNASDLSSGLYIYTLKTNSLKKSRKMILLK